jgi:hypothetical protein
MQIISGLKFIAEIHYEIFYQWKDSSPNHGFGFPALKSGEIDMAALEKKPAALANYNKCVNGEYAVTGPKFQSWEHSYRQPAIGRCTCGCEVILDSFTNTCDRCNRDYNSSGQLLAPRSQWGEETGESYCDLQDL